MELDPKEFQRRRQRKQDQRRQQQKKQRRMILRLGLAAVALILTAILIISVVSKKGKAEPETTTVATQPVTTQPAATQDSTGETGTTPTMAPDTVLHLAFGGDLNITPKVVGSATGDYDYTQALLDVTPVLAQADLTVLNFEGSFFGAPYGEDRSAPPSLATALKNSGVDMLQLANSYSIYKGMDGLASTVKTVREAGMLPVGAYANTDEAEAGKGYTIQTVQGVKIAFVAFTKGMHEGMTIPPGNEKCVNLLYSDYASDYQTIDEKSITEILSAAKEESPDMIVALLHWGSEYNNTISTTQNEICQLLQENGVSAIIGTHSHFLQEMKLDPQTGNFVAYSLGDFMGEAPRSGAEYSVILDLEVTKNGTTGKTTVTSFSYTPIYQVLEEGKPMRVLRIREAITAYESGYIDRVSEATYNSMKNALEACASRAQPIEEPTEENEDTADRDFTMVYVVISILAFLFLVIWIIKKIRK